MSKKLLALLLALVMIVGSFTSVLAEPAKEPVKEDKKTEEKAEEKKDEKSEEKKDEKSEEKKEEKTEEKTEEKKEEVKDEALLRAIDVLKKAGFISGYSKDSEDFKAEKNVTRAEFASMIVRVKGLEDSAKALANLPTGFKDVPTNLWANGYIAVAKQQGFINGYPNGTFQPNRQISYQDMATMLTIALGQAEAGTVYPAGYIVKAQQLGLFNNVKPLAYTDMATRGDVFKMVYNMVTSKEFGKRKILKAIVLENNRVENLADDEVTVEVIDVVQKADWVDASRDKRGDQHTYKLDKDLKLDAEDLLGKVVDITVDQNDKIVEVKVDKTYDYVEGAIDSVGLRKLEINGSVYSAKFDEKYDDTDERIFRTYLNNKNFKYVDFAKKYEAGAYDFARVTVKNGKVIFVDAYKFDDIAPVAEVKDGNVYYLDDAWSANVVKAGKLNERVIFRDKTGYSVAERKAIAKDDVLHFYNDYKDAIVRKDAKVEAKLDKTLINKYGEFVALGKDEYYLNKTENFRAIYSYEGKKYFVLTSRKDIDSMVGDNVKVLVALDGSAQLIEGSKPWNDGVNAIKKVTSRGEVKFLPSTGEEFWAGETRDTSYFAYKTNNARLKDDFRLDDIVYLSRGEKEDEIRTMGTIVSKDVYAGREMKTFARIDGRHITLNANTANPEVYRYFNNVHFYALEGKKGADATKKDLVQIGDLSKFIAANDGNKDLEAYVMSEKTLKGILETKRYKDQMYTNAYKFLSESEKVASIVVFNNAVTPKSEEKVYAEVLRKIGYTDAIEVRDANSNVFVVEVADDKDCKIGDIVELRIKKDTMDKDVRKGYVKGIEIARDAESFEIKNGAKPGTYEIGTKVVDYDARQIVFYPSSTRRVQYTLDDDGFVKVMRYVKEAKTAKVSNILDKTATTTVVLKDEDNKFVADFYVTRGTEFFDAEGRYIGSDQLGLKNLITEYGDGLVDVIASGRFAVTVRGVKTIQDRTDDLAAKAKKVIERLGAQTYNDKFGNPATAMTVAEIQKEFKEAALKALFEEGLAKKDNTGAIVEDKVTLNVVADAIPSTGKKEGKITTTVTATIVTGTSKAETAKNDYLVKETADVKSDLEKREKAAVALMQDKLNKTVVKIVAAPAAADKKFVDAEVLNDLKAKMADLKVKDFDASKVTAVTIDTAKTVLREGKTDLYAYTLTFTYTNADGFTGTSDSIVVYFEN